MTTKSCHSPNDTPRQRAKALLLKTYGVRRVSDWTGVKDDTVYQWLSRATDDEPVPPDHVAAIIAGARAAGLPAPLDVLNPKMAAALQ